MVRGLERFREYFAAYADRYVLIGGTAAALAMEDAGLSFRATKDLDIVLIVEALDAAFGRQIWQFVKDGDYEIRQGNTGHPRLYRFQKPIHSGYPHMIELFSRRIDDLPLPENATLTPLPIDEAVSSLSAILLDDEYYDFIVQGRRQTDQLAWVDAERLIPLKASAWLDLTARVSRGERIDANNVRKHINDVFRLSQLLSGDLRISLPEKVARDLKEFLARADEAPIDLTSLKVAGPGQTEIIARLHAIYELPR